MLNNKRGFTLIEIILVLTIVAISSGIMAPVYISAKNNSDIANSTDIVVSSLRKSQLFSLSMKEDSSWGVKILNGEAIIFKGNDYLSRDIGWDESFDFGGNIKISGIDEFVFSKFSGKPLNSGDLFLSINNKVITININSLGVVSY